MTRCVITQATKPEVERVQARVTDRFQRYVGLQIEKYECEIAPAAPVPSFRSGFLDMAPGWYYVVRVRNLRAGAPVGHRGSEAQFFATVEERQKYIDRRLKAYRKKVEEKC